MIAPFRNFHPIKRVATKTLNKANRRKAYGIQRSKEQGNKQKVEKAIMQNPTVRPILNQKSKEKSDSEMKTIDKYLACVREVREDFLQSKMGEFQVSAIKKINLTIEGL